MTDRIKVKQMNESIYLLDDNGEATGYLVVGKEKAAVIDTTLTTTLYHPSWSTSRKLPTQRLTHW